MQADRRVLTRATGPRFLLEADVKSVRSYIFPVIFGIVGAAILCALGVWQMQRLEWKEAILADLEQRLAADVVDIPTDPRREVDNYRGVEVGGELSGKPLHVLTSLKSEGPGFRVIRKFEALDGRTILLDLGFIPEDQKNKKPATGALFIEGNLIWPNETDSFTPNPNRDRNIWFARDVDKMSKELGTLPIMVVARDLVPQTDVDPLPVTVNVPNDHFEYAVTWFSLMAVWIVMTLFLLWRIKRENA